MGPVVVARSREILKIILGEVIITPESASPWAGHWLQSQASYASIVVWGRLGGSAFGAGAGGFVGEEEEGFAAGGLALSGAYQVRAEACAQAGPGNT